MNDDFSKFKNILNYYITFKTQNEKSRIYNIMSDNDFKKITGEDLERDEIYTRLLSAFINIYTNRHTQKERYKWIFFKIVLALFCFFLGAVIAALLYISFSFEADKLVSLIPIYISALISIVTSIIVLPSTIAKYLFNPDEDKEIVDMIKHMQDYDLNLNQVHKNK